MNRNPRICRYLELVLLLLLLSGTGAYAESAEESAVKAAFVFNFAMFTEWPAGSVDGACRLCVIGDKAVEPAFRAIDGKNIGAYPLRVTFMRKMDDLEKCQIVFIGQEVDHAQMLRILAAVKGRSVLTIGEKKDFARIGGAINFINKDGHLRFEINPETTRRQNLKISSRLLKLAVIVDDK